MDPVATRFLSLVAAIHSPEHLDTPCLPGRLLVWLRGDLTPERHS